MNSVSLMQAPQRWLFVLLAISLMALPASAQSATSCTWINQATASGLLGGKAAGEVTAVAGQPTVCTFLQQGTGLTRTLRVTVEIALDAHERMAAVAQSCGVNSKPLKAIGNEAVVCAADDSKGGLGERVVGRVRDQVFTITLGTNLKNDPFLTREMLQSKIYTAAEQVAGNLF